MTFTSRSRLVNPLLGTYFGIIASLLVGLVLLLLILERLGLADATSRVAMLMVPLVMFVSIAIAAASRDAMDFYVAGRRVPAFFNGLVLAIATLGGTGIVVLSGALFLTGFDVLCIFIGLIAGLVAMALLLAPFMRKFGAFTIPGYLTHRFRSPMVGLTASAVMAPALILLAAAEIGVAARLGAWLTGQSAGAMIGLVLAVLLLVLIPGGARSQSWAGVAKAILASLSLLVPTVILATVLTNLPLPQLSHGPVLRALGRSEFAQGMPITLVHPWAFELPDQGLQFITKRFANPFGSVGSISFTLVSLIVMAGVACSPALLMRAGTTTSVYETRKSMGWAVFVAGAVVLTLSAMAVFMRNLLADEVTTLSLSNLPAWFRALADVGLIGIDAQVKPPTLRALAVNRDALIMALPIASGMPPPIVYLSLAGGIAAALVAASQTLLALSAIVAEDIFRGPSLEPGSERGRLIVSRAAIVLVTAVAGWMTAFVPLDPLDSLLWSLTLTASVAFPVLVLSVWWKRITAWGAVGGMAVGFQVCCFAVVGSEAQWLPFPGALAGAFAMPAGLLTAVVVSLATAAPSRSILELVRDLRIPGGEAIIDRETRLLHQKHRQHLVP